MKTVLARRKWFILGWTAPIVGLLLICWFSWVEVGLLSSGQPIYEGHVREFYGDAQVGQTFVAPYSGLYRVDVLLLTYGRINTHDIVFHLKASPEEEEDLLKITINARQAKDTYFGFTFPRIPDSAGKTFFFYLDSPESVPGDAITIGSKDGDPYAKGAAYLNGSPTEQDLTFVARYRAGLWEIANAVLDRLVGNKPSIWGDRRLHFSLAFLYLALLGLLFGRVMEAGLSGQGMEQR